MTCLPHPGTFRLTSATRGYIGRRMLGFVCLP